MYNSLQMKDTYTHNKLRFTGTIYDYESGIEPNNQQLTLRLSNNGYNYKTNPPQGVYHYNDNHIGRCDTLGEVYVGEFLADFIQENANFQYIQCIYSYKSIILCIVAQVFSEVF